MKIHIGVQSRDGSVVVHSKNEPLTTVYSTADEFWAARGRRKAYLLNSESGDWFAMDYNDNWPRPAPMSTLPPTEILETVASHGN